MRVIAICCVMLLLVACGSGSGSSSAGTDSSGQGTVSCTENFRYSLADGGQLLNNVWNKSAAGSFAWSQCLVKRQAGGLTQFGWTWVWPDGSGKGPVYAYPEIGVGNSPWTGGPQGDSRFPVQISSVKSMVVSYDIETVDATDSRNLATEMWITDNGNKPAPSSIKTELMIWSEIVPSNRTPSGSKRGETADGNWEVWVDDSGQYGAGSNCCWTYIAYRAKTSTTTIGYDVRILLDDAIGRGYVDPNYYVTDLELGNEVMGGVGTTWIKSFSVTVDK